MPHITFRVTEAKREEYKAKADNREKDLSELIKEWLDRLPLFPKKK